MNAANFKNLCDSVQHAAASLRSCMDNEIPNEKRILDKEIDELRAATLARKNDNCEARRCTTLEYAYDSIYARCKS